MIGNRRRHARQVVNSPVYVALGSSSGGLLYDISEGGLAVDIVGPKLTDELIDLGFEMPETERHFEASGQTTWKKEPGSRAGLKFVNLPEASHQQIKEWLSVRAIPGGFGDIASPSDAAKTKWFDPPSMQRETLSEAPVPGSAAEVSQVLANDAAAPEYTDARPTAFTTLGSSSAGEGTVSRSEGNYEVTDLRHSLFHRSAVRKSRLKLGQALLEELRASRQWFIDETKKQLASMIQASLESLTEATTEQARNQLTQWFQEQAQIACRNADAAVQSVDLAAKEAVAQLQAAHQKMEASLKSHAEDHQKRLAELSSVIEELPGALQHLQQKTTKEVEDELEKVAKDLLNRSAKQLQEQADVVAEALGEELRTSISLLSEVLKPSSRPVAPAAMAEPKEKEQPVESDSSVRPATPIRESTTPIAVPPSFGDSRVPRRQTSVWRFYHSTILRLSEILRAAQDELGEWVARARQLRRTLIFAFNLPRPQERARTVVASSPPAPSASSNDIRAQLRTSALAVADSAAEEQRVDSVPPAVQVVPVGEGDLPAAKASDSTASRSHLDASGPLAIRSHENSWEAGIPESWLDQRAATEPAAANRFPRRRLILAGVSICLFLLVPVAAWFALRRHSGSKPVAVNSGAVPAQASSESAAAPSAEPAPKPAASATQVSAQTQAMVATVPGSRQPPKDSTNVPSAPAAPGKPASPRAKPEMRLGTLTVPAVAPAQNKVAREEPLPAVVDSEVPGAVPGGQPGGIIGILSKGSAASAQSSQHGGQVVRPRLTSSVKPDYPPLARLQRVEGDVVIQAEISATGSVGLLKVVSGPALLQQAAMEALRKWKYEPARLNDQPIALQVLVTIRFRIK